MSRHRVTFAAAALLAAALVPVPAIPTAAATAPGADPAAVLARLTEAQRVGQLLMVGLPLGGSATATRLAISSYHAGSVILTGRSSAGVSAVHSLAAGLQALATGSATGGVPLYVAADQEGGKVQTLSGPGFDTMPTALAQGQLPTATLRGYALRWGRELLAAGVNLNLAPVLDTVPPTNPLANAPIGAYQREYGYYPATVTAAGTAFLQGMQAAGTETVVKHFPGLGRASGNTDTTFGVYDRLTTRHDSYLTPYAAGLGPAGAGLVMVSLATYTQIDPAHRAVFSPTVLSGMLRQDLGFTGVIMSDSMDAVAVQDLTPGQRAVGFIQAGGDLVLATHATDAPAMASALLARANADPAFRARVDASCLRILIAKQRAGLLAGTVAAAGSPASRSILERVASGGLDLYTQAASGTWSGPALFSAAAARTPAIATLPGGAVELAEVTGSAATAVRAYRPGSPGAWLSLGGSATSAPALAAAADGRIDVAVRGPNFSLYLREYRPGAGWSGWSSIGGGLAAGAALAYSPSGDLSAVVVGQNQAVYRNVRHLGHWSGWRSLGGVAQGVPAAATDPATGALVVIAASSHGGLWWQQVGSTGWVSVPGIRAAISPAAAGAVGSITVVSEGLDGHLYLARHAAAGWTTWSRLPFD